MAEEFQAGVCGENWWNPSRSEFMASPCSLGVNDLVAFGYCPTDHMVDSKTKAFFGDSSNSSSSSLAFEQDNIVSFGFGFGVSTSTSPISDFNQVNNLLNGRVDSNNNYESILQEDNMCTKLNCRKESSGFTASSQIQKDCWSPNNLDDDTTFNSFIINNKNNNQGLSSSGFPIISSANSFGYNTTTTTSSTLLQSWFDNDESDQSQQSFYNNNNSSNNPTSASNNSTPFWNIAPPPNSSRSHFLSEDKHNCLSLIKDNKNEEVEDYSGGSVVKKSGSDNQTLLKRPRIETPSPLPTFKVRKEKLGDRITALQQLVSPFGKTDTASVLHEAIEYIKFLHDQVSTLSSPYLKNGAHNSNNQQQKESECPNQDLNSRGLCLVPISSTVVPLASETTADFWTLTFGLGSS